MSIIGIDPGATGGIAIKGNHGVITIKLASLYNAGLVEVGKLQSLLIKNVVDFAVIEKQRAMSGQGNQHSIGVNYGRITATLELCGIKVLEITPQKWKKHFCIKPIHKDDVIPQYRKYMSGGTEGAKKNGSVLWCLQNGYTLPAKNKRGNVASNGVSDAIMIMLYGEAHDL